MNNRQQKIAKESPTVFQEMIHYNRTGWKSRDFVFRGSLFSASFFFLLCHFSASGLSNFWCGRHFSASGLSNFWRFFGGFVFATQRRFLPKLKICPSSVSSTNLLAQNSKLENNASDNTSLLLMYRRYNLLFYSQFSCAIACFLFSNISAFFVLHFQCIC